MLLSPARSTTAADACMVLEELTTVHKRCYGPFLNTLESGQEWDGVGEGEEEKGRGGVWMGWKMREHESRGVGGREGEGGEEEIRGRRQFRKF